MFWQPATSPRLSNLHFSHLCHTVVQSTETKLVCLLLICFSLHLLLCARLERGTDQLGSRKPKDTCSQLMKRKMYQLLIFCSCLSNCWLTLRGMSNRQMEGNWPWSSERRMAFVKYSYCMDKFLFYFISLVLIALVIH